ncbi:MAG: PKD domain-containing protein [Bacteroidota bacterium]
MKTKFLKTEIILISFSLIMGFFFSQASYASCQAGFTFVVQNDSAYFTNTSTGYTYSLFNWNFGDGTHSGLANPVHHFNNVGDYIVHLTVTDSSSGCNSTFIDTVHILNVPCHPAFSFNTNNGLLVYFSNTSWGSPISQFWDFGDGSTGTLASPSHTFPAPGSYQVCLTNYRLTDTCTYCATVIVTACTASFSYSNSSSQNIAFSNYTTGNPVAWHWNFGDGTYSTLKNPVHQFIHPGNNMVCMSAYSAAGDSCTICQTVCVCQWCQASYTYVLNGNTVTFTNTSNCVSGNASNYIWNLGDGTISTALNPVHTYANGVYQVRLSVFDTLSHCYTQNCDTTGLSIYQSIAVNSCSTSFSYTNGAQNSAAFTEQPVGTVIGRHWTFGDGTSSNSQNPVHNYPASGTYYTCLDNYTTSDTCSHCDSVKIGCVVRFHWWQDTTTNIVSFYNTSYANPIGSYWDFGDGTNSSVLNANHTYTLPGAYQVCLTSYTHYDTCMSCDTILVTCSAHFNLYPDPNVAHQYYVVNQAVGTPPIQYLWSWGDGTFDNIPYPTHTYSVAGYYTICLTITDAMSCSKSWCDYSYFSKDVNSMIYVNVIAPTGISDNQGNKTFSIYPNPANDILHVQLLQNTSNAIIKIYNLLGQINQSLSISTLETNINIADLARGSYLIEVISDKNISRAKFIKE